MNLYESITKNLKESNNSSVDEFVRLFENKYGKDSLWLSAWGIPETPENLYYGLMEEVPNDDTGYYDEFKDENGNFNPTSENLIKVVDFLLEPKGPEASAEIITKENPKYEEYVEEIHENAKMYNTKDIPGYYDYDDISIGHNLEKTENIMSHYYCQQTGSKEVDRQRVYISGGGLSPTDYSKIIFNDGTLLYLIKRPMDIYAYIKKNGGNAYQFDVYKDSYRDILDEFIRYGKLEKYNPTNTKHLDAYFTVGEAIENKGKELMSYGEMRSIEENSNSLEEMLVEIDKLSSEFPAIWTSGMWNGMSDGKMVSVDEIENYLKKDTRGTIIDDLILYENLLYLKTFNSSEMG